MEMLNEEFDSEYDSCLLTQYRSGSDFLSRHQDNEDIIDNSHPICNLSLGSSGEIQFWNTPSDGTGDLVHHIFMQEGTIVIMKPECQAKLWHEVLKGDVGKRYCLSFRKYKGTQIPISPVSIPKNLIAPLAQSSPLPTQNVHHKSSSHSAKPLQQQHQRNLHMNHVEKSPEPRNKHQRQQQQLSMKRKKHLIIGDSLVKGLNIPDSIHICRGGIHPRDVLSLLPGSMDILHPDMYDEIRTVTLIVGTNSLNVTGHEDPIPLIEVIKDYEKLVQSLKLLFPFARIGLFNIIPRAYSCRETLFRIEIFNTIFSQHNYAMPGIAWIKLYWDFVNQFGYLRPELYGKSGVHLSFKGKQLMKRAIINFQQAYY